MGFKNYLFLKYSTTDFKYFQFNNSIELDFILTAKPQESFYRRINKDLYYKTILEGGRKIFVSSNFTDENTQNLTIYPVKFQELNSNFQQLGLENSLKEISVKNAYFYKNCIDVEFLNYIHFYDIYDKNNIINPNIFFGFSYSFKLYTKRSEIDFGTSKVKLNPGDFSLDFFIQWKFCNSTNKGNIENINYCGIDNVDNFQTGEFLEFEFNIYKFFYNTVENKSGILPDSKKRKLFFKFLINDKKMENIYSEINKDIKCEINKECLIKLKIPRSGTNEYVSPSILVTRHDVRDVELTRDFENFEYKINSNWDSIRSNSSLFTSTNNNLDTYLKLNLFSLKEIYSNSEKNETKIFNIENHEIENLNKLIYDVTDFTEEKLDEVDVYKISIRSERINLKKAKINLDFFIFKNDGRIKIHSDTFSVSKGDIKMKIKIENWEFCKSGKNPIIEEEDGNCKAKNNKEEFKFLKGEKLELILLFDQNIIDKNSDLLEAKKILLEFPKFYLIDNKNVLSEEGYPYLEIKDNRWRMNLKINEFENFSDYEFILKVSHQEKKNSGLVIIISVIIVVLCLLMFFYYRRYKTNDNKKQIFRKMNMK